MALSEIEKLERRYAENPQGLTFAPLAEVHRKNGEVQRALDLLGPGLGIHPDYIPASIVLGRCHMDLGDVQAAESAFLHVLALDGENVIALKALADISERLLKFDDAERWLNTLLTVDRSNDEARDQLQRVEISRRQAEVATSAEPAAGMVETSSEVEVLRGVVSSTAPDTPPDTGPQASAFEPPVAEPTAPDMEDLEPSALREAFDEPAVIEFRKTVGPDEESPVDSGPLDGLVGREVDIADDEAVGDLMFETSDDILLQSAGGSEFQMPDASQELFGSRASGERGPFEEDAPVQPDAELSSGPDGDTGPVPAEDERAAYSPEPFLYEPPRTYEPPVAESSPASYGAAPSASEPFPPEPFPPEPSTPKPLTPEPLTPPPAPPQRWYGADETGGRSVVRLFKDMLASRPPAQSSAASVRQAPAPGSPGAPTRPASDALSLSSVFGDEGSETPPAVPASGQGPGSVSFDDFFNSSSATPASRAPHAPDPKNDDLDQFHAWLQNLKR